MKIYTKSGDKGETALYGGKRISKDSARIKAYGDIDELNAILGVCANICRDPNHRNESADFAKILQNLQHSLFIAGADLAAHLEIKTGRIKKSHTSALEKNIDKIDAKLPPLKNFIFPGGNNLSAYLHLARTVCRRAEREVVTLSKIEKINPQLLPWLNRLSDLLFVMARRAHLSLTAKAVEKKFINKKSKKT